MPLRWRGHLTACPCGASRQDEQLLIVDTRDFDLLSRIHTEDATWSFALGGQVIVGPLRGRNAIMEFTAAPTEGEPARQRHVLTNLISSDSTDTTVQVSSYLTLIAAINAAPTVVATATAQFSLVLQQDTWRIAELRIEFDDPPLPH